MISKLKDQKRLLQAQLNSALQRVEDVTAVVEGQEQNYLHVCLECDLLRKKVNFLKKVIVDLEWRVICLLYTNVKPGGRLNGSVEYFTFFPNFDCNDAFLDVVNYTNGCEPGEGLCGIMVRFHHISVSQRQEYQQDSDAADDETDGADLTTC